jgi:hypothetical protein
VPEEENKQQKDRLQDPKNLGITKGRLGGADTNIKEVGFFMFNVVYLERLECKELWRSRDFNVGAEKYVVPIPLHMDSSVQNFNSLPICNFSELDFCFFCILHVY